MQPAGAPGARWLKEPHMSGAMQRETEKAEEIDLEQKPKVSEHLGGRLIVFSYPTSLSTETAIHLQAALEGRMSELGAKAIVLDQGASAYEPNALGPISLELSALREEVGALAEMVLRLVGYIEAGEEEERPEQTLDGEIVGGPRDQSRSL